MRPDEFDDVLSSDVPAGLPSDLAFEALEAELVAAGSRARRMSGAAPDARFVATLRGRLMAQARVPVSPAVGSLGATRAVGAYPEHISHQPAVVNPRLAWRNPTALTATRWPILAAAALIVALVGLNASTFLPVPATSRVASAVGAELVRNGATTALTAGTELLAGDEIRVGADGAAALQIGDSRVRLAGGSDLGLRTIDRMRIELDQVAGRVWHRVAVPTDGRYVVTTAGVTWTARGTAFDLDRSGPDSADGDIAHELSVQHGVTASGAGLLVTVDEGHGATVVLGERPSIETAPVDPADAASDPWIRGNASRDLALGLSVGMLDGLDLAAATTSPTWTPGPTRSPDPTDVAPAPTDAPTDAPPPTPSPTPKATPRPTPRPTPAPTLGTMGLVALACPGGVTLDWTVPEMAGITHIQVVRGTSGEVPIAYPPGPGVVAIDGGYTSDLSRTSGYDPRESAGSAWYRAVAYSAQNKPLAASDVRAVTGLGPASLGSLGIAGSTPGELSFSWTSLGAAADCFTYYKIVKSADDPTPSYLTGATAIAAIGDQAASGATVAGLPSGSTYYFRVEAIRATSLGKFVVGASTVLQATVP